MSNDTKTTALGLIIAVLNGIAAGQISGENWAQWAASAAIIALGYYTNKKDGAKKAPD